MISSADAYVIHKLDSLSLHSEPLSSRSDVVTSSFSSITRSDAGDRSDENFQDLPLDTSDSSDAESDVDSRITTITSETESEEGDKVTKTETVSPCKNVQPVREVALSPYEKWLIRKEQVRRQMLSEQVYEEEKARKEERLLREKKTEKQKVSEARFQEWLGEKEKKLLRKKQLKQRKEQVADLEKEKLRRATKEKARSKYQEWLEKKATEEEERQQHEEKQKQLEQEMKQKKRIQAEEAFEKWKQRHAARRTVSISDFALGHPPPTFCNPRPWIPPDIPKTEQTKKKKVKHKAPQRQTRQFLMARPRTAFL